MARDQELRLPGFLEQPLALGHPWVYRDHVPAAFEANIGDWVRVRAGAVTRYALWDAESSLRLRVFPAERRPDGPWFAQRIERALADRDVLRRSVTSAYRWLAGEGDGLPGIVADLYGAHAVLKLDTRAAEPLLPALVEGMRSAAQTLNLDLKGIVRRSKNERELAPLWGRMPPERLIVEENALRFCVDLRRGQKTGLFLDHRQNRAFLEPLCAGARVLNLYSYTGAFSLYAVRGGATRVVSVDRAAGAARDAAENFRLNGFDAEGHDFVVGDVLEYLADAKLRRERFDVVICDPPSFARNKAQRGRALNAYRKLNQLALELLEPRGILASASCTTQVSPEAFRSILTEAGGLARRELRLIHDAGHAIDHPIAAAHGEGRYLKFMVFRADATFASSPVRRFTSYDLAE